MILIDTNSLIVLIIGMIDPKLIGRHKRTSIYEEEDYNQLTSLIRSLDKLIVLPNIWTEVDNLLNGFIGGHKWKYIDVFKGLVKISSERYIESAIGCENIHFSSLGLTDSLILEIGKKCEFIITSDSKLSDFANAEGLLVYDLVKIRNERFND